VSEARTNTDQRQSYSNSGRLIFNSRHGRVDLFELRVDADRSGYFDNDPSWSHEMVWGYLANDGEAVGDRRYRRLSLLKRGDPAKSDIFLVHPCTFLIIHEPVLKTIEWLRKLFREPICGS
jgi:hypothetical protein